MAARRRSRFRSRLSVALAGIFALGPLLVAWPAVAGSDASLSFSTVHAAGDENSFVLPMRSTQARAWQGEKATFVLSSLLSDQARKNLDMSTVQLSVANEAGATGKTKAKVSADRLKVTIPERGEWTVKDGIITYTPEQGTDPAPASVNLRIRNVKGALSRPATLTAQYPHVPNRVLSAPEGVSTRVPLTLDPKLIAKGSVTLTLADMPTGTALADDGKSMIVPGEGTWRVRDEEGELEFLPLRDRLGEQPTPIQYRAIDRQDRSVGPATVTLQVPVIADIVRSSPYGEVVTFDVSAYSTNIDASSLELVPYAGGSDADVSHNGATVTVSKQGVWKLDRASGKLRFTPVSPAVTDVSPMGIRGRDAQGDLSSVAPVRVGYPQVSPRYRSFTWGSTASFTPLVGTANVQHQSFKFVATDMPIGTEVSTDGKSMSVPKEGIWQIDSGTLEVTFIPVKGMKRNPTPATFSVKGMYAGNETRGVLNAQYSDIVPSARDDEATTADSSAPIVIDVLANDTPASASQAFDASTLQLRSALATNVSDLVAGTGKRLVIPDQGTFQVTDAGAVEFTPASGFRGKTKPVDYVVQDRKGLRATARIVVEVDHRANGGASTSQDSGVNALLGRLLPESNSTFSMYASITALLCFTGVVSLWVGRQIERGSSKKG